MFTFRSCLLCLCVASHFSSSAHADYKPNPADQLGLDPTAIDRSVSPCDDFYQYACGNWIQRTELPGDRTRWTRSFSVLSDNNTTDLRSLLENYAKGDLQPAIPPAQQLGDYYTSCMNQEKINKQSDQAVRAQLTIVKGLRTRAELPEVLAKLRLQGIRGFFTYTGSPDLKNSAKIIAEIDQGGMSLPGSNYYTQTDERSVEIRRAFVEHIQKMFQLIGYSEARAQLIAQQVLQIETQIAERALPPEQLQDPAQLYHPVDARGLRQMSPRFDWRRYQRALGVGVQPLYNIAEPSLVAHVDQMMATLPLEQIRHYLQWHALEAIAPSLNEKLAFEWFRFNLQILNGQKVQKPRWRECIESTSADLDEALGQAFVELKFSAKAKERVNSLIENLKVAFQGEMSELSWLDVQTRRAALEKLSLFTQKIGYPEKWRDYSQLQISRDSFWRNSVAAAEFNTRYQLSKIGGVNDPLEWQMSPQMVNAYYDPSLNQINFPAAILQPPFFSTESSDASNYGAIGMVIGHEFTHGFDTSGSQFDGHGQLHDWWSADTKAKFGLSAQCLVDQYNSFEALPGLNVNGEQTKTENIADQGGLRLAFLAYRLSRVGQGEEREVAGLTADQQFFVSMAQLWCTKQTDAALRNQVLLDPHSPARFRVNGSMMTSLDFAQAFQCAAGKPMAPAHRCNMW